MLFFLFVLQPGLPSVPEPASFVTGGLACLGGIAVALLAFRFLLPIDPARRLRSLMIAVVRDLITMAEADSRLMGKCRARMQHRVLRMLAQAGKLDHDLSAIVEGGLAALVIGRCLQRFREAEGGEGIDPLVSGATREIVAKFSADLQRTEKILAMLEDVSITFCRATEAQHGVHDSGFHEKCAAQFFQAEILFVEREKIPCHI